MPQGLDMTTEQYMRRMEAALAAETASSALDVPDEEEPTPRARLAGGILTRTLSAVGRGAARSVNELSNTVAALGVGATKVTGAYQLGRDENEEQEWLDWYERTSAREYNPLQIDVAEERESGVLGFVESASQFAVGMIGFGKFLKPVQAFNRLGKGASTARSAAAGFLTDTTMFDAHEERLSNLIQSGPEWIRNPLTDYLEADEEDGELEARLKAGAEGLLMGATVDALLYSVRAVRAARRVKSGQITAEEGERLIAEATEAAEASQARGSELVEIVEEADGTVTVAAKGEAAALEEGAEAAPTSANFPSRAAAESYVASIEDAVQASKHPTRVTEEHAEAINTVVQRILTGAAPLDSNKIFEGIDFNFNRMLTGDDVKGIVNVLSEAYREAFDKARGYRSWSDMRAMAREAIPGLDEDDAVAAIRELWGDTEDLDVRLFVARQLTWGIGQNVARLSRAADLDPSSVRMNELAKALDSFLNATEALAGSKANVARGLASLRSNVEGWVPNGKAAEIAEAGTKSADEVPPRDPNGTDGTSGKGDSTEGSPEPSGTPSPKPSQGVIDEAPHALPNAPDGASALQGNGRNPQVAPKARRSVEGMSARDIRALARQIVWADGDPTKVLKLMRASQDAATRSPKDTTFFRKLLSFRTEMMLSGPKTQVINFTNNLITAFQHPAEYWWAGVRSGRKELRDQGWDMMVGNLMYYKDALTAARKAWQIGDNVLDPSNMINDTGQRFSELGTGWLAKIAGVPSRALMSSDEFFKQMQYRANVRAQSLRLAREQGITDPARLAERVADDMKFAFDMQGGAVNPMALQHARHTTFTSDLGEGTMGKTLQDAAGKHPFIRLIFPFVRTPVNIFRYTWERTPGLNRFLETYKADLAAGGERAALAKAKSDMGKMMYSVGAGLVMGKMISGGGPSEPRMRQAWLQAGNQPYSITVGGKQISYRRLEPIATPLALIADAVESFGEMGEEDAESLIVAIPAAITSSVSSKTFLQGMTEFFDAVSSGEPWAVERAMANIAGSFVPNAARQLDPDPVYRETRGILDEVRARIPGLSAELEPRRNLFGEVALKPPNYFNRAFNPFTTMNAPSDRVAGALLELGKALEMPSPKYQEGRIDLSDRGAYDNGTGQSPYDRWMELIAEPKGGGTNLRTALERRIESEGWDTMSSGNDFYPGGRAHKVAARIVDAYQRRAFNQMLREYPLLKEAIRQERRLKAGSFRSTAVLEAAN